MMIAAATKTSFSKYDLTEVSGTLRSCGCDIGGGQKHWSYAVDLYNQTITGDVTMTLCCERMDPHHLPCVVIVHENIQSD